MTKRSLYVFTDFLKYVYDANFEMVEEYMLCMHFLCIKVLDIRQCMFLKS